MGSWKAGQAWLTIALRHEACQMPWGPSGSSVRMLMVACLPTPTVPGTPGPCHCCRKASLGEREDGSTEHEDAPISSSASAPRFYKNCSKHEPAARQVHSAHVLALSSRAPEPGLICSWTTKRSNVKKRKCTLGCAEIKNKLMHKKVLCGVLSALSR